MVTLKKHPLKGTLSDPEKVQIREISLFLLLNN